MIAKLSTDTDPVMRDMHCFNHIGTLPEVCASVSCMRHNPFPDVGEEGILTLASILQQIHWPGETIASLVM